MPLGLACGILRWAPDPTGGPALALRLLIAPALVEEAVFRGPLLWPRIRRRRWAVAALLAAYVAQHPILAALLRPDRLGLFADPCLLALVALLGAVASALVLATGRLWPAILVHWAAVAGWLFLLGGLSL